MHGVLAFGAAVAATLALSSCVTDSNGLRTVSSHVSVIGGKRTEIDAAFAEKKDCSLRTIPAVHVVEAPKHGSFDIVRETLVPDVKIYRSLRSFPQCNGVPVIGTVGYYKPVTGFVGSDRVVASHSYGDGRHVLHKIIDIDIAK